MMDVTGATLWDLLEYSASERGDKPAFLFPSQSVSASYVELRDQAAGAAKGLMAAGLKNGEHVALWAPNRPDSLAIEFGCAAIGTPLVMLNSDYRILELEYALQQTDVAALLIADHNGSSNDYVEVIARLCPELLVKPPGEWSSEKFPKLRCVVGLGEKRLPGMLMWSELIERADTIGESAFQERKQGVSPHDTAFILFTSGTTGEPKGAMISHANYLVNTAAMARELVFDQSDRLCLPLPFFHAYCLCMVMLAVYFGAACVVYERFNANQILQSIETGSTVLCGTPTMFVGWLEALRNARSEGAILRMAVTAGASCPAEMVNSILEKTSIKEIWNLLGMTETLLVSGNRIDCSQATEFISVGKPLIRVEAQIESITGEEELPPGENGELLVRSPGNMLGYYGKTEATSKAIDARGWYHSGDMAFRDLKGNISIVGRIKEVIIRGGENIFPREIEEYLLTHPKVKEAQVVGIPSEYYGEEPVAFVILHQEETATQLELKKYCRERIALFKVPVYIYFVESFPKTASGKIQKFKLQEQAAMILNKKKEE
ncbi:MAG: AMP-binding protein [Syntrophomonas sp.]